MFSISQVREMLKPHLLLPQPFFVRRYESKNNSCISCSSLLATDNFFFVLKYLLRLFYTQKKMSQADEVVQYIIVEFPKEARVQPDSTFTIQVLLCMCVCVCPL